MKHVYFLKYNNYANRIFKRGQALQDYLGVDNANFIAEIKECNLWNPNDGITTVLVTPVGVNFSVEPDYLIATDEYGTIDSRWFVTETIRLLRGQYRCHLKRDVFAEAWEELMASSCNIDRAILLNNDPLTYNPEPISVNQILVDESPIRDKTKVPWIVFYAAEKLTGTTNYDPTKHYYDVTTDNITTWKTNLGFVNDKFNFLLNDLQSVQILMQWITDLEYGRLQLIPNGLNDSGGSVVATSAVCPRLPHIINPSIIDYDGAVTAFRSQFTLKTNDYADEMMALNGKILYDSTGDKYYRIGMTISAASTARAQAVANSATHTWAKNTVHDNTNVSEVIPGASNIITVYTYASVEIALEELVATTAVDFAVPALSTMPSDAPYYMWCMPYGEISMKVTDGGVAKTVTADPQLNLAIANWFANKNTADKTFDVQILPFCPLPDEFIDVDGNIEVNDPTISDHSTIVQHSDTSVVKGFIFACPACSFTRQIRWTHPLNYLMSASRKLTDICERWRLYAPNYSSSFEFSGARNNGIRGFNIRCTYMPVNPYIRVAPIWSGLYGNEQFDKDPRGLICSGNYSIARLNDQWVAYQEQNKNFEAIFNREIEHMDVQRKYERAGQIAGAIAGTVTGAAAGAVAGSMAGPGAIAGGVIGAIGAAVTGAADVAHSEKLFEESKSYATDIHFLQLGNVQALPRSLAKTTAFNVDNRYFPIIATYRPTEKEVDLVDEYINKNSMNVGAVGKPIDYIYNRYGRTMITFTDRGFISGSIIKIDSVHDTHFVDELNKEFQKGVYLR